MGYHSLQNDALMNSLLRHKLPGGHPLKALFFWGEVFLFYLNFFMFLMFSFFGVVCGFVLIFSFFCIFCF